jgi:hypothetical protein
MLQRGRKLAVISASGVDLIERMPPPRDLNSEEAIEWREIVDSMPPEWLTRGSVPLLVEYVRHIVTSRRISELLRSVEERSELDILAYEKALRLKAQESRAIAQLATKLRLSQQTIYDRRKQNPLQQERPWQVTS